MSFVRRRISPLAHWPPLGAVLLAFVAGYTSIGAASAAPTCGKEMAAATSKIQGLPPILRGRVEHGLPHAVALFRFQRSDDALALLDALVALLDGPRGERLEDAVGDALTTSIRTLRTCVATSQAAPLATITIHAFDEDGTSEGGAGRPVGEGASVDVEGIPVSRTGPDSSLQAVVPSGTIGIRVTHDASSVGRQVVTLSPGAFSQVSVVLAEGKEPSEDSDLVFEEAADDVLPADAASLTLTFVQDETPVRISQIVEIALSDDPDAFREDLKPFFTVVHGVMQATNLPAVRGRIAAYSKNGRPLSLAVIAIDTQGRGHYGRLRFQVGEFRLAVTLAPPPSNPALRVSNIKVRVTVGGGDVAMTRTSDAQGRFEIESLPDATLDFEAHTEASGMHYYTNASLTLCGNGSVTIPMLSVKDIVAGTPGMRDRTTPQCSDVPRR